MGNNTTQGGRSVSLRFDDFHYYDKLPPTARAALANAAFNWSSGALYNRWNKGVKGYKSGRDITERVREADASVIKKEKGRSP